MGNLLARATGGCRRGGAQRPLQETEVFRIAPVAADSPGLAAALRPTEPCSGGLGLVLSPVADPGRMRDAGYCPAAEIDALWEQKTRLDALFDAGDSALYWRAREELYPAGQKKHERSARSLGNRAGDKLAEIAEAVGGLQGALRPPAEETTFVDVCGAPGAWSKYLYFLGEQHAARMKGYGFSLRGGSNPKSCTWYKELSHFNFVELWGADGTGDIFEHRNLVHASQAIGRQASIVVADGACGVGSNWGGDHLENYQEIVAGKMVLGEVFIMLETLRPGGCFVCKLFDTFSHLMAGVLFICAVAFEEVFVVKPRQSRIVNSERYLVCKNFRSQDLERLEQLAAIVGRAHAAWETIPAKGLWSGAAPMHLVRPAAIEADKPFYDSFCAMARTLCEKQAAALQAVVDRALELEHVTGGAAAAQSGCDDPDREAARRAKRRRTAESADVAGRGPSSAHGKVVASVACAARAVT
eukprot:TRINITY_DN68316_c0_g2_i2.p1 TRINITY_DN68316_c0_g2~~TRINITY_DN68316_c0_g2_i2.p1  ORF type:complete len:471 (-),score=105.66 TRINITY_DN68316_c0_g2_i2:395-1807(-)